MAKLQNCQWILKNSTTNCNRRCIGEYCGVHAFALRSSPNAGTHPCVNCQVGVRGNIYLCDNCGRKAYRALLTYYRNRSPKYIFNEQPPTVEQFITKYKNKHPTEIISQ